MSKHDDLGFKPMDNSHSDLGFQPTSSRSPASTNASVEGSPLPGMDESALRGLGQGVTLGLQDELAGAAYGSPMGGLKAIGGLLGMDNSQDPDVQAYVKSRDESRAANKLAEETNPGSYMSGELIGGLVPGIGAAKLLGPAAKGLTLASDMAGPLNQASLLQKGYNAAKAGAVLGAASAPGLSNADLSKGEGSTLAKDVAVNTLAGGALGGALDVGANSVAGAVKGAASVAGKTDTLQKLLKSFKYGKEGIDTWTKEGKEVSDQHVKDLSEDIASFFKETNKNSAVSKAKLEQTLRNSKDINVPIEDRIQPLKDIIGELDSIGSDSAKADKDVISKIIDRIEKGREVEIPTIMKGVDTVIAATPSGKEQALAAAQKLQNRESQMGGSSKFHAVDIPENNEIGILKTTNDPIGSGEQLVPGQPIPTEQVSTKIKGNYSYDNQGKMKAMEQLDKLQGQAEHEGSNTQYRLVDDKKYGFYRVAEDTPVMQEGPPSLDKSEANNVIQNASPTGQYFPNTPGVPEQKIPGQDLLDNQTIRVGGGYNPDFAEASNIKNMLSDLTPYGNNSVPQLKTQIAENAAKRAAGGIGEALSTATPELGLANKKIATSLQGLKELGLDYENDFMKDNISGKTVLTPQGRSKILGALYSTEKDTEYGAKSNTKFENAFNLLKQIVPEQAEALEKEVSQASEVHNLIKTAQGIGIYNKSTLPKTVPIIAGNLAGKAVKAVGDEVSRSIAPLSSGLKKATPEVIQNIAKQIGESGVSGAKGLSEILSKAVSGDSVKRNATLFTIEQNPAYRQLLRDLTGQDDTAK